MCIRDRGETGFLAETGNVEAMSNYCIKLLQDENLLSEMKQNALKQAQRFDIQNIIPKYEAMYQRTIEEFQK